MTVSVRGERLSASDLTIPVLGESRFWTPMKTWAEERGVGFNFVDEKQKILFTIEKEEETPLAEDPPLLEMAGPRQKIFFDPRRTRAGIVTCGGLCPGINNVIRSLVMTLHYRYGVEHILGFPYGYEGLTSTLGHEPIVLTPEKVKNLHHQGGTYLSSSRGPQSSTVMVRHLARLGVSILFVIGGDGTLRGALDLSREARRLRARLAVVGIPKTIDNDIKFIDRSFGFETAFGEAMRCVANAHVEALGTKNGVGLVKVMGRDSGFITCHAALADPDVNIVLIPEQPFRLEGKNGFLGVLKERLRRRKHAVVVVAEGAGQTLFGAAKGHDPSGNAKLQDIGVFLRDTVTERFRRDAFPVNVKYIDPSYMVRSVPPSADDSVLCLRLGQAAVHAAMAGKTELVVGERNNHLVHLPMALVASGRRKVDVAGPLWQSVLEATGQPPVF